MVWFSRAPFETLAACPATLMSDNPPSPFGCKLKNELRTVAPRPCANPSVPTKYFPLSEAFEMGVKGACTAKKRSKLLPDASVLDPITRASPPPTAPQRAFRVSNAFKGLVSVVIPAGSTEYVPFPISAKGWPEPTDCWPLNEKLPEPSKLILPEKLRISVMFSELSVLSSSSQK